MYHSEHRLSLKVIIKRLWCIVLNVSKYNNRSAVVFHHVNKIEINPLASVYSNLKFQEQL